MNIVHNWIQKCLKTDEGIIKVIKPSPFAISTLKLRENKPLLYEDLMSLGMFAKETKFRLLRDRLADLVADMTDLHTITELKTVDEVIAIITEMVEMSPYDYTLSCQVREITERLAGDRNE